MGGSGNSNNGDRTVTRQYAPYIESLHSTFLNTVATYRTAVVNDSPFSNYAASEVDTAFFGIGYTINNLSSLYDMFGNHMIGLDVEILWKQLFDDIVNNSEIDEAIAEEMKLVDEEIVNKELANFQVDMRNLNAVSTSSFIIGKAIVESKRIKTFAEISLDARTDNLSDIEKEYTARLNQEKSIVTTYAAIMKAYFIFKPETDDVNTYFGSRGSLWPFNVLAFEGMALGTMQGVASWQKTMDPRKRSDVSKAFLVASYTATGAYIGSSFGPYGTVIGGVVGFVVGVAIMLLE